MNSDEIKLQFMRRAVELARENVISEKGGPFGALVIKDDEIIAEGTNLVTSTNDPTAHAEIVAIRRACEALKSFQLDECEIYTSCEPCPMCFGAIYWARPKKVYYSSTRVEAGSIGFDDKFIYDEINCPDMSRSIPFEKLAISEAQEVFEAWAKKEDKISY
jgi:tRNA(Arg) A34 adenosine deaminase TadA